MQSGTIGTWNLARWDPLFSTISSVSNKNLSISNFLTVDDTLQIREVYKPNDERDPFPILSERARIPINRYDVPDTFPTCLMEVSDAEVQGKWLKSNDFMSGVQKVPSLSIFSWNFTFWLYSKALVKRWQSVTDDFWSMIATNSLDDGTKMKWASNSHPQLKSQMKTEDQ